jgi:hypothetical protein
LGGPVFFCQATVSKPPSAPVKGCLLRHFRICVAFVSFQSWMMCFRTYRSPPKDISIKISRKYHH